jgi:hypothetical protein
MACADYGLSQTLVSSGLFNVLLPFIPGIHLERWGIGAFAGCLVGNFAGPILPQKAACCLDFSCCKASCLTLLELGAHVLIPRSDKEDTQPCCQSNQNGLT